MSFYFFVAAALHGTYVLHTASWVLFCIAAVVEISFL